MSVALSPVINQQKYFRSPLLINNYREHNGAKIFLFITYIINQSERRAYARQIAYSAGRRCKRKIGTLKYYNYNQMYYIHTVY